MLLVELARRRPWLTGLGAAALLSLLGLALLHSPPVRARMFAWIAARFEPAGLIVHADRLDYDLTRLDVRIFGLTLATAAAPTEPFLRADQVHATLGWATLSGRIAVHRLEVERPRIALLRRAGK